MMFTRAQVRKQKSNEGNSSQRPRTTRTQQQQISHDARYKQAASASESGYSGGGGGGSGGGGASGYSGGRVRDRDRYRDKDRERDRDRERERERERNYSGGNYGNTMSSGYYSDRYSSSPAYSQNPDPYKQHSHEQHNAHSREGSTYLQNYENSTLLDKRTRPRSITNRRGAIKHQKTHDINGHRFVAKFFRQPTFCAFCNLFLWGFGKQGYQCITCQTAVHKKCHEKLLGKCSGSVFNSASTILLRARFKIDMPHRFKAYTFMSPTFCDHCGSLMGGFFIQGLKCEECDVNCHKKCARLTANLCGVNQKLIVEALASVKRAGGRADVSNLPASWTGSELNADKVKDGMNVYKTILIIVVYLAAIFI